MIERTLRKTIISSLKKYPVMEILSPRQVGKTTLANMIRNNISGESIDLDLELPSDINKLQQMNSGMPAGIFPAPTDVSYISGRKFTPSVQVFWRCR